MFGAEQATLQARLVSRLVYRPIGEYRFPIRLRWYYLKRVLQGVSPARIWDAGCGNGQTTFSLAHRFPNAFLQGTDISQEHVAHCQSIAERQHLQHRMNFSQGDLTEVSYPDQFDLIVCFEVLEHIENFELAIHNLSQSLRRGGILIIHTPAQGKYQADDFGLRKLTLHKRPLSSPCLKGQYHVRPGFEPHDLIAECKRNDLVINKVAYTFGELAI